MKVRFLKRLLLAATAASFVCPVWADDQKTPEAPQIRGDTPATSYGWTVDPVFTVGESFFDKFGNGDYTPPGILDGIGAFPPKDEDGTAVRILVNHELRDSRGYRYELANGTVLTGARVSCFDIDYCTRKICSVGLAYDRAFDRAGDEVVDPMQINEGDSSNPMTDGFNRFCSSYGFRAGKDGLVDNAYFTGEETSDGYSTIPNPAGDGFIGSGSPSGLGGQECVLDVDNRDIYVAPMMGRAAFENVCTVENFDSDKVAILIGDDRQAAPLYLYIGEKGSRPEGPYNPREFLVRNGLGNGCLLVWVDDEGGRSPDDFNGTGNSRKGRFVPIKHYDPSQAGQVPDWDDLGFASLATQDEQAEDVGCFRFSRPEDLAGNPNDGTQILFCSTGRDSIFPNSDAWGTNYIVDFKDSRLENVLTRYTCEEIIEADGEINVTATITIAYDGDDAGGGFFSHPDLGIRSPDNCDWGDDGYLYINEDRSIGSFGDVSRIEASIWRLDPDFPNSGKIQRIAEMDRTGGSNGTAVALPDSQTDSDPTDVGDWESSGVLDVTSLFKTAKGEKLLITTVQAHSVRDGNIGGDSYLAEGGQLAFLSKYRKGWGVDCHRCGDKRAPKIVIRGSDADEKISIAVMKKYVLITSEDTPINGKPSKKIKIGKRARPDICLSMNGGNDEVVFLGADLDDVNAYLGNGDDVLLMITTALDDLFAVGGQGTDVFVEVGSFIGGAVRLLGFETP